MDNKEILKNIKEIESKYKIIKEIQKDIGYFLNYELFMPFVIKNLTLDMKYFSFNYTIVDDDGKMVITFLDKPAIVFDLEKSEVFINDLNFITKKLEDVKTRTNNTLKEESESERSKRLEMYIEELDILLDKTDYNYCYNKIDKKVNELNNKYDISLKLQN
ncbi:hypothetical protein CPT_Machias_263 [Staphylococcus phage Machias]|nr:hypothetical protein CPT_Machias_263 [Staphylococcus phage Machias]